MKKQLCVSKKNCKKYGQTDPAHFDTDPDPKSRTNVDPDPLYDCTLSARYV